MSEADTAAVEHPLAVGTLVRFTDRHGDTFTGRVQAVDDEIPSATQYRVLDEDLRHVSVADAAIESVEEGSDDV